MCARNSSHVFPIPLLKLVQQQTESKDRQVDTLLGDAAD